MTVKGYKSYLNVQGLDDPSQPRTIPSESEVECVWFEGKKEKNGVYDEDLLDLIR